MLTDSDKEKLTKNEYRILSLINESPRRFEELKEKLGISSPVLSKHTKHLQNMGLIRRNPNTRGYEAIIKLVEGKSLYEMPLPTNLGDIQSTMKLIDLTYDLKNEKIKSALLDPMIDYIFLAMITNIVFELSKALKKKDESEMHESIKDLIDSYVAPYIHLYAMYFWKHKGMVSMLEKKNFLRDRINARNSGLLPNFLKEVGVRNTNLVS